MREERGCWNVDHGRERLKLLESALQEGGLFAGKAWQISPWAFPIESQILDQILALGPALRAFQRACEELYFLGIHEASLSWVTELLDRGKPDFIVALGRQDRWRGQLPAVLRPDLLLTQRGLVLTEIDSVPGGIGLTGRLGELHAQLGDAVLGGARGMPAGFARAFPGAQVLISAECGDYLPEMHWLVHQPELASQGAGVVLESQLRSESATGLRWYRFFELFDLPQIPRAMQLLEQAARGELQVNPPPRAFLEEKIWLALFHAASLRHYWREALGAENHQRLAQVIPEGWVLDPTPLAPQQQWPGLQIHRWEEIESWGRRQRELVIKVSGYSPLAWGARSVNIGHDLSQAQWRQALRHALGQFAQAPHVMQRFHSARQVEHPMLHVSGGLIEMRPMRARLCPYFFASAQDGDLQLGGVLATLCPADKKILHGMRDAMLLPCTTQA